MTAAEYHPVDVVNAIEALRLTVALVGITIVVSAASIVAAILRRSK